MKEFKAALKSINSNPDALIESWKAVRKAYRGIGAAAERLGKFEESLAAMETVLSISTQYEDHAGETVGARTCQLVSSPNIDGADMVSSPTETVPMWSAYQTEHWAPSSHPSGHSRDRHVADPGARPIGSHRCERFGPMPDGDVGCAVT